MANATDAAMWHGFKTLVLLDSFIMLIRVAHPTHNTPPPLPPHHHPCVLSDILLMYFEYWSNDLICLVFSVVSVFWGFLSLPILWLWVFQCFSVFCHFTILCFSVLPILGFCVFLCFPVLSYLCSCAILCFCVWRFCAFCALLDFRFCGFALSVLDPWRFPNSRKYFLYFQNQNILDTRILFFSDTFEK